MSGKWVAVSTCNPLTFNILLSKRQRSLFTWHRITFHFTQYSYKPPSSDLIVLLNPNQQHKNSLQRALQASRLDLVLHPSLQPSSPSGTPLPAQPDDVHQVPRA